jgi:glucosamine--fructose-6-phosphate aminotransferase (isomerizing)
MAEQAHERRTHMEAEIVSQPHVWKKALSAVASDQQLQEICEHVPADADWLFIGCGSSYYIAQAAAAMFVFLGLHARAVPASDLLLYPSLVLDHRNRPQVPVLISRSGKTSEILQAGELLERKRGIRTIGITCSPGQPLEKISSFILKTLAADEQSTVMTRSFTSMLLGLQLLGAKVAHNRGLGAALEALPDQMEPVLPRVHSAIRDFVRERHFADYVVLAQGPLMGVAQECALKITESSVSYAQCFHTLEFRHGPKSIVSRDVLCVLLLSDAGYDAELEMLKEIKDLGGSALAVANRLDARAKKAADLSIELGLSVPEVARFAAYVTCGQLLGLHTGLQKGLNPDEPRNLSRVVVLNSTIQEPRA